MKMKRRGFWHRAVAALVFGACVPGLWAAGTITSSLVVNGDSEFRGNVTVVAAGTGSAPTNGLTLYCSFNTNTTPVADDSGNGHTGTVSGATWVTNGITGGAYSFDGNDFIDLGDPADGSLDWAGPGHSVSFWMKLNSYPLDWGHTVLSKSTVGHPDWDGYWFGMWNSELAVGAVSSGAWSNSAYARPDNPNLLPLAVWHHIVGVWNDTGYIDLYYDGAAVDCSAPDYSGGPFTGSATNSYHLMIGRHPDASYPRYFNGSIDELRIYNRTLSADEVRSLYFHDAHMNAGSTTFETSVTCKEGVEYVKPLGDILMGVYTNSP